MLGDYDCDELFVSQEGDEIVPPMSLIECDEEKHYSVPCTTFSKGVKEGKELKFLTSEKLLTKLIILLSQIKPGNKSN